MLLLDVGPMTCALPAENIPSGCSGLLDGYLNTTISVSSACQVLPAHKDIWKGGGVHTQKRAMLGCVFVIGGGQSSAQSAWWSPGNRKTSAGTLSPSMARLTGHCQPLATASILTSSSTNIPEMMTMLLHCQLRLSSFSPPIQDPA